MTWIKVACGFFACVILSGCLTRNNAPEYFVASNIGIEPEVLIKTTNTPPEVSSATLSLNDTIAMALEHNPDLVASAWGVESSKIKIKQAALPPNPELEIEVEEFGGDDEREGFDVAEGAIVIAQEIQLGGKRSREKEIAKLNSQSAMLNYNSTQLDVIAETESAFYNLLAAQEHYELEQEKLRVAQEVLKSVKQRVEVGKEVPLAEANAELAVSASRMSEHSARQKLTSAKLKLAALWGGANSTYNLNGELGKLQPLPKFSSLLNSLGSNPEFHSIALELQTLDAEMRLAKAKRYPDIEVAAGIQHFEEDGGESFVFGVSLPLQIFDRGQYDLAEAEGELNKAKAEKRALEIRLRSELLNSYQEWELADREARNLTNELIPTATRAYESALEGYQRGKYPYLSVLEALRTLQDAREQNINAWLTCQEARITVQKLTGKSIKGDVLPTPNNQGEVK